MTDLAASTLRLVNELNIVSGHQYESHLAQIENNVVLMDAAIDDAHVQRDKANIGADSLRTWLRTFETELKEKLRKPQ